MPRSSLRSLTDTSPWRSYPAGGSNTDRGPPRAWQQVVAAGGNDRWTVRIFYESLPNRMGHSAGLHRSAGQPWCRTVLFGCRTDNAVKNRWAALCKKDPQLEKNNAPGDPACDRSTSALQLRHSQYALIQMVRITGRMGEIHVYLGLRVDHKTFVIDWG